MSTIKIFKVVIVLAVFFVWFLNVNKITKSVWLFKSNLMTKTGYFRLIIYL